MQAENEKVLLNVFWRNAWKVEPNWRGKLARGHAKWVLWLAVWHPSLFKAVWGEEGYRRRISKRQGVLEEKTSEGWWTSKSAFSVVLKRQSKPPLPRADFLDCFCDCWCLCHLWSDLDTSHRYTPQICIFFSHYQCWLLTTVSPTWKATE